MLKKTETESECAATEQIRYVRYARVPGDDRLRTTAAEQFARIDQAVMRLGGRRLRIGDFVDDGVTAD